MSDVLGVPPASGWRQWIRLRPPAGPTAMAATAALILSLLFFFDEFDTAAFGTLAPNIEKSFHLTDQKFVGLIVLNVSIILLLAIPIGYLADRIRRTPLVVLSGILAGVFSFSTGLVGTVALLTVARFGNGLGLLANGPVHNSLLADYYPAEKRGEVYAYHLNAMYLGAIIGPLVAGVFGTLFGWQSAFLILLVPIVATSLFALRLVEPVRGGTDDATSANEIVDEKVSFREGVRTLWAVRSLRRQFWGSLFFGAGLIPLVAYLPLYLQRVFNVDPFWRGVVGSANATATFVGIQLAGRWTTGWFAKGMGEPLRRAGAALAIIGVVLVGIAASPFLPLALAGFLIASFTIGVFQPPFYAVQALVSPARARTMSFSFGALFLVGGVVVFFLTGLSAVSDDHGMRWGVFVLTPFWLVAGAYLASASRFVNDDAFRALQALAAAAEVRRQRTAAGDRSMLLCAGVDVAYESVQVLFGVDFEVREGEIVALLGTNGAGKSTLLNAISGLVDPVGGAIFFDGHDVTHSDPRKSVKLGIVQMPGGRSIFPTLTVAESLRIASWMYRRRDPEHVRRATDAVLEAFPILRDRSNQLAGNLSGGEQQMLGLGMALIAKPRLLMIDELSLGLAPLVVGQLVKIVKQIHQEGTTVVLVEQSVNVALTLAQRAVFMEKGEVRFSGPTAELLQREDILRSVFLEGAASVTSDGPRPLANGLAKRATPTTDSTILELSGVTKHFGGVQAVSAVNLRLARGEILGLIGPNGAGKTTIFDLISGFEVPDSGRITLDGRDITGWSPERRGSGGLGRSFQDSRLFPSLTVAENIAVALERHLPFRDPLANALGLPAVAGSEVTVAWEVHELIELLGLGAYRNKFVRELSTGSRRIVDLAMAIAHQPSVLILDEPSSGIAQRESEALGPLLVRIQAETDCSLMVIEHDMPLVTSISDRLVALELGRVIAEGTPDEVVHDAQVVASYLGTEQALVARSGGKVIAAKRVKRRAPTTSASRNGTRRS